MKSITVIDLIKALQAMPEAAPVMVWMPGSYINLNTPWLAGGKEKGTVLMEGNVAEKKEAK